MTKVFYYVEMNWNTYSEALGAINLLEFFGLIGENFDKGIFFLNGYLFEDIRISQYFENYINKQKEKYA